MPEESHDPSAQPLPHDPHHGTDSAGVPWEVSGSTNLIKVEEV